VDEDFSFIGENLFDADLVLAIAKYRSSRVLASWTREAVVLVREPLIKN
jgi:hypothetical protein